MVCAANHRVSREGTQRHWRLFAALQMGFAMTTPFVPRAVNSQQRALFQLAFMPGDSRKLRPTGIHIFRLRYWADWLCADVANGRGQLEVRYDPRDISCIYVEDQTETWQPVFLFRPQQPFSLREHQAILRELDAKAANSVDEEVIHQARLDSQAQRADSSRKTRAARRQKEQAERGYEQSAELTRSLVSDPPPAQVAGVGTGLALLSKALPDLVDYFEVEIW
ncbi:Mu transposase C-terminal domain-containing protein [Caulobacter sp. ErkDOM-E]|uniref:Mu transposase C-terminal domain-containing protein n=1 Tax=Caulobacter sp. ErkDOM-E TaxID=3402778 RepID=UPI003AF7183E